MPDANTQATSFEWALNAHELHYDRVSEYEKPLFIINFGGGEFSYNHVAIHVLFDEDGGSVQLVTSPISSVPLERSSQVLLALNECNCRFRWVKFYLDKDNDVIADADQIIDDYAAGDTCFEIVIRMASIIDEAYAEIMKAVWA